MGTSTHNEGQKGNTPLVPSWLDAEDNDNELQNTKPILPIGDSNRFRGPRGEFTRYINSDGTSGGMVRRSISNYIRKSLGGSTNASQRMGSSKGIAKGLLKLSGVFSSGGIKAVEKYFSLDDLKDKTAAEVFTIITDFVCPDGGQHDEGIARDAYISAIVDLPELLDISFSELSIEQINLVIEKFIVKSIINRIHNDIGNKIITLPDKNEDADRMLEYVEVIVSGAVSDAFVDFKSVDNPLSQRDCSKIIDDKYRLAFAILESLGDDE